METHVKEPTLGFNLSSVKDVYNEAPGDWNHYAYLCLIIAFTLILVISMIGNITIFCLFILDKSLRTPTNLFILSIVVSDLLMTVIATPLAFASAIAKKWLFGDRICHMYGFIVLGLGLVSLLSHGAIAIDRYFVIAKPQLGIKIDYRIAGIAVIGTWLWAFLWAIFPLVGWSGYTYEGLGTWCSVIWQSESGDRSIVAYVLCLFFFTYILTVICMAFCYTCIYFAIREVSRRLATHSNDDEKNNFKREQKVLRIMVIVALTFFAAWTPYGILGLWATIGDPSKIPIYLITSGSMCGKASTALNPLIYTATNRRFRGSIKRICHCTRGETRESESRVTDNLILKARRESAEKEPAGKKELYFKVPFNDERRRSLQDSGN